MSECTSCRMNKHRSDIMQLSSLMTLDEKMSDAVRFSDHAPAKAKKLMIETSASIKEMKLLLADYIRQVEAEIPSLKGVPRRASIQSLLDL